MFFRTSAECYELAKALGFDVGPAEGSLDRGGTGTESARLTYEGVRLNPYILARNILSWFGQTRYCLLWITEFGIWPSSENLHMYYTIRRSYNDLRSLMDAPGHVFLGYEEPDILTFLQMTIQFGWGGFMLGTPNLRYMMISHDEWILLKSASPLADVIAAAEDLGLRIEQGGAGRRLDA